MGIIYKVGLKGSMNQQKCNWSSAFFRHADGLSSAASGFSVLSTHAEPPVVSESTMVSVTNITAPRITKRLKNMNTTQGKNNGKCNNTHKDGEDQLQP